MRKSRVELVLEDFLEEEFNCLSYADLKEVKRIKEKPESLCKSYLLNKLKYYVLPFIG